MSDTSTLFGIKYKGKMIELPKDSSVSWNDLEDKPTTSSTFTLQQVTNDTEANNLTQLYMSTDGQTVSNFRFFKKNSNKDLEVNFYSNNNKNDYWDYAYYYSGDKLVKLTDKELDYVVIKGVHSSYIMVAGIALDYTNAKNSYIDYFYSNILPTPTLSVTTIYQKYSPNGKIFFRLKWEEAFLSAFNFTACRPILNEEYTFLPQYINAYTKSEADNKFALDTSVSELWDTSAGPDLSDYYTKAQIDTSIANNYASKNDISAFITNNDISTFVTNNDISTFITANDVSNKLEANDVSIYITSNDISTFITANDVSIYLTSNDVSLFASKSDVSALDTSVSQLWDSSTSGGGSTDLTDYYTKSLIDTSIANNYATKSSVTNIDTSVSQLWDSSTQGGGSGISLQYLTQAEYDALQVKDPNTLYLIEETLEN